MARSTASDEAALRIIQVGAGKWGAAWLRFLGAHADRVRHAALVDVDPAVLAAGARKAGIEADRCFTDLDAALRGVDADAVLVVVPPALHRPVIEASLDAGLPVVTEKPLAGTRADCIAIAEAAARAGLEVAVAQNYRFRPVFETARRFLAAGGLGEIGQARLDYWMHVDLGDDFRTTMDHPLLLDMSVHHFDLLRFVTGLEARSVLASTWNPRWSRMAGDVSASCLFTMENDARVVYSGSWHARGQHDDWNCTWLVECDEGYLRIARGRVHAYIGEPGDPTSRQTEREVPLVPLASHDQVAVLDEFVAALREGRPASTTASDNVRTMEMVFGAVESVQAGHAVELGGRAVAGG